MDQLRRTQTNRNGTIFRNLSLDVDKKGAQMILILSRKINTIYVKLWAIVGKFFVGVPPELTIVADN